MSLDQLREEYERETIGQLIYREVEEAVSILIRRYDPRVYGGVDNWRDGREDVIQGVVADMLLRQGQLDYIFAQATNLDEFRRLLIFQSKRYLARNRQRTIIDNLLDRAKDLLSKDPFSASGSPTRYKLIGSNPEDRSPSEGELAEAARYAAAVPRVGFNVTERAPIVYSRERLGDVLEIVASRLPCFFSLRDLQTIFELLLTDWVPGFLEEVEEEQAEPRDLSPEEEVQVTEACNDILSSLEEEEGVILRAAILKEPDRQVAQHLQVTRQTVIARRQRLYERLKPILDGLEEHLQTEAIGRLGISLVQGEQGNANE